MFCGHSIRRGGCFTVPCAADALRAIHPKIAGDPHAKNGCAALVKSFQQFPHCQSIKPLLLNNIQYINPQTPIRLKWLTKPCAAAQARRLPAGRTSSTTRRYNNASQWSARSHCERTSFTVATQAGLHPRWQPQHNFRHCVQHQHRSHHHEEHRCSHLCNPPDVALGQPLNHKQVEPHGWRDLRHLHD